MTKVVWTSNARESYLATLEFLLNHFDAEIAITFDEKVETLIQNIKLHKHFCPPSLKYKNLRRCTISKYSSLVYSVEKDYIAIIVFYDNRSEITF